MTTRQGLVFESAVHRRRKTPATITVDDIELTLLPERPDLAEIGEVVQSLQSVPDGATQADQMRLAEEKRQGIADVIKRFLIEADHDAWDGIQGDFAAAELTPILHAIIGEYTGVNPTQRSSSSDPSSPSTDPSTAG